MVTPISHLPKSALAKAASPAVRLNRDAASLASALTALLAPVVMTFPHPRSALHRVVVVKVPPPNVLSVAVAMIRLSVRLAVATMNVHPQAARRVAVAARSLVGGPRPQIALPAAALRQAGPRAVVQEAPLPQAGPVPKAAVASRLAEVHGPVIDSQKVQGLQPSFDRVGEDAKSSLL